MTKKILKTSGEKCVGMIPLEFREDKADAENGKLPEYVHLVPVGEWDHDLYGKIVITQQSIREFVQNFDAKIRKGVFITTGHEGFQELPAAGWVTQVEARDDGLWGKVEWNEIGKTALSDKQYKFFSPEFYPTYEDPQSHSIYHNVLTGGALTKSPYFKELQALVMSDKIIHDNKQFSTMDLSTILAKKLSVLTQEEKEHIKKNASKLTDGQKTEYASILDDNDGDEADKKKKKASEDAAAADEAAAKEAENLAAGLNADGTAKETATETDEEKVAREEKEKGDANEAAGLNRDGSAKVSASEKVMITAGELAALKTAADKGALAFKELEATKLTAEVSKLVFSETNKEGRFLPKSEVSLKKFMETLNATQRAAFSTLIKEVPATTKELFTEKGTDTETTGTAQAELDSKVSAKLTANPKMKYSDALKEVFSENEGLQERYNEGLAAVKG